MTEKNPLRTGSSDKHAEDKTSTSQQKIIDTAKLGLAPQKLDESTLSYEAAKNEKLKKLARTVEWWNTDKKGLSSSSPTEQDHHGFSEKELAAAHRKGIDLIAFRKQTQTIEVYMNHDQES